MVVVITIIAVLLIPYQESWFTFRGWPFEYHTTADTHGLCIGFQDEIPSRDNSCGKRYFRDNYMHLAEDIAIFAIPALVIDFFFFRRKTNS